MQSKANQPHGLPQVNGAGGSSTFLKASSPGGRRCGVWVAQWCTHYLDRQHNKPLCAHAQITVQQFDTEKMQYSKGMCCYCSHKQLIALSAYWISSYPHEDAFSSRGMVKLQIHGAKYSEQFRPGKSWSCCFTVSLPCNHRIRSVLYGELVERSAAPL
jgi:hypothetical protein